MMQGKMLAANISYRIVNVVLVFIINLLLSRLAGVAGYGLLSLLIANAGIFNLLSAFGADAGISFHTASGKLAIGKLLSFIFVIICFQLVMLVFAEMICWSVTGHMLLFKTYDLSYWWLGPLFLTSISIIEKYSALLNGKQKFTVVNKVIAVSNLLMLFVFAILYLVENPGSYHFYISAYVVLNAVQAVILIITFHATSAETFTITRPHQQDTSTFFSYSLFTFVINIIQFLAYRVDYWLLDYYKGEQELGWYSLAVRLGQLFWVLPLLFASMILPMVASKAAYDENRMLSLIRGMNLLNIFAGIILFFIIPYIIPFLFGIAYENSVSLLQIMLPGVILFCVATVLAAYFAGRKKLKTNLGGSLLCLVTIFLLDMMLIPEMGMKGAAIAATISYGLTAVYFIIAYCYSQKVNAGKLFLPQRSDYIRIGGILKSLMSKD